METKIIGIILLVCAALLFQYSYDDFMDSFFSPSARLKSKIEDDITFSVEDSTATSEEKSQSKSETESKPKSKPQSDSKPKTQPASKIHHVKFIYRSEIALKYLKKNPPSFETNSKGTTWLEVEVLDLQDEEAPGFITQISVFDMKTKNKIGEFGNTYLLKDFDKNLKNAEPSKGSSPVQPAKEEAKNETKNKEH